ncbi:glycosyltransferase family 2 protein [Francisellaceae bacterium]|nr:glycosyltransferase family 2 protein [Francisellaceae bacterium]
MSLKASLIISTYNWPSALEKVLVALNNQTYDNFEVLVVDDGSKSETKELVKKLTQEASYDMRYFWQDDKGFRLSKARNMGIENALGNYLIFIDGDCIPRPSFIKNHIALAEAGYFVCGNRILLSESFSNHFLNSNNDISTWGLGKWLFHRCKGSINRWHSLLSFAGYQSKLRKKNADKWQKARGCNLAFWKQDLVNANGFEERFVGWGYEDSDMLIRLLNAGIKRKSGKFSVPVLHIWHKEASREEESQNLQLLENIKKSKRMKAEQGLYS